MKEKIQLILFLELVSDSNSLLIHKKKIVFFIGSYQYDMSRMTNRNKILTNSNVPAILKSRIYIR